MITFERMRTAMVLFLMLVLAVLCNLAPDESKPWHIAQLFMVGGVYIARDYLQTLIGDYLVLIPMGLLVLIIWSASENPYASSSGFLIGLTFGWAIFSQSHQTSVLKRMLSSVLVACAVDSGIYLSAIGRMDGFVSDTAMKVVPLALLYTVVRTRQCLKTNKRL
ncbi:hypothetical protein [Pseudomonas sp.]|uniref:hypothetical protein n=1 Tax=Pseudomonas sp. TaxID=306 RepID=UPI002589DA87|nr:hypothetical protein [Pseudomonas sp.]